MYVHGWENATLTNFKGFCVGNYNIVPRKCNLYNIVLKTFLKQAKCCPIKIYSIIIDAEANKLKTNFIFCNSITVVNKSVQRRSFRAQRPPQNYIFNIVILLNSLTPFFPRFIKKNIVQLADKNQRIINIFFWSIW